MTIDARSRILPGVGYLLESDITHDPAVILSFLLLLSQFFSSLVSSVESDGTKIGVIKVTT